MTFEKWQDTKGTIKDNFKVEEGGEERLEEDGGTDIEYIVFHSPQGLIRLEFISKPVVLDRKTNYSKRIGSETKVDYVYSETEKTFQLLAYKWNDIDKAWEEIDNSTFSKI